MQRGASVEAAIAAAAATAAAAAQQQPPLFREKLQNAIKLLTKGARLRRTIIDQQRDLLRNSDDDRQAGSMNIRRHTLNFAPRPAPRGRDGKELIQCPTSSCDGMGHVSGNYATHRRQGSN
ncbi:hypothetical protein M0804_000345 [Polistes exclamans]|nr:hypothetical protein M0804_000345 [Polistes exclamans]